jgi:hypothetical protein
MDDGDAPVVPSGGEWVYRIQSDELETMVVTPRSFVSCNNEGTWPELVAHQFILAMGERDIYRENKEVKLLLGDRWSRDEYGGEIYGVGVV